MENLKQGDIIVNEAGERKILGICGLVYILSEKNSFNTVDFFMTIKDIKDNKYTLKKKDWPEKYNDNYWSVGSDGGIGETYYDGDRVDEWRKAIGNMFKTKAEAEAYKAKMLSK